MTNYVIADKVVEECSTLSTGTYSLDGASGVSRTFRSKFPDQAIIMYVARRTDGTIWEHGRGKLVYGTPDTIQRIEVIDSSNNGSAISWVSGDTPYIIFSPQSNYIVESLTQGNPSADANPPAWLPAGGKWWDKTTYGVGVRWLRKMVLGQGGSSVETGRYHVSEGVYTASQSNAFVDNGAAGLTLTAAYKDRIVLFDVTAANRTFTMPAGATLGHGFSFGFIGYGSTSNSVVLTPNGSEKFDFGSNGATLSVPGQTKITWVSWDGAKSQWRTDYTAPTSQVIPRGHLSGVGTTRASTTTVTCAAGMCTDSTGAVIINVASALTKSTAGAWAAGNNQNGMGQGLTIANNTSYHVMAFVPSGTAMVNGVYAGDFYFDTSPTGANKPTGSTYFRRIASFKTNGSAQIINYIQDGDLFQLDSPSTPDYAAVNPGTSAVTVTSVIPTGVRFEAIIVPEVTYGSSGHPSCWRLSDLSTADLVPSRSAAPYSYGGSLTLGGGITPATPPVLVMTNTSAQYRFRTSASGGADSFAFMAMGWRDTRGRND